MNFLFVFVSCINHKIDYFFLFILPKFEINLTNMLRQRVGDKHIFNSSENRIVSISSRFITIKLEIKCPYLVLHLTKTVIKVRKLLIVLRCRA